MELVQVFCACVTCTYLVQTQERFAPLQHCAICTTATLCHLQVANMEDMRRSEAKESEVNHRFVEHMQWWGLADCHMYRQQWHTAVLLLTQQVAFAGEPLCWHQMLLTCKVVSY